MFMVSQNNPVRKRLTPMIKLLLIYIYMWALGQVNQLTGFSKYLCHASKPK